VRQAPPAGNLTLHRRNLVAHPVRSPVDNPPSIDLSLYLRASDLGRLLGGMATATLLSWSRDNPSFPKPIRLGRTWLFARAATLPYLDRIQAEAESGEVASA